MKKQFAACLSAALLVLAVQPVRASVVISNTDPANYDGTTVSTGTAIGQSMLTGNRAINLTSIMLPQTAGATTGETVSVFSRNSDGTVGTVQFTDFAVGFDNISDILTATASSAFTLQANTGYWFVLRSAAGVEWDYTTTSDYASSFGATLPLTRTAFSTGGGSSSYYNLSRPQVIQVNGSALAAVPEPASSVWIGLVLAGGVGTLVRRRLGAA